MTKRGRTPPEGVGYQAAAGAGQHASAVRARRSSRLQAQGAEAPVKQRLLKRESRQHIVTPGEVVRRSARLRGGASSSKGISASGIDVDQDQQQGQGAGVALQAVTTVAKQPQQQPGSWEQLGTQVTELVAVLKAANSIYIRCNNRGAGENEVLEWPYNCQGDQPPDAPAITRRTICDAATISDSRVNELLQHYGMLQLVEEQQLSAENRREKLLRHLGARPI